jgi:hypothetical protein
MIMKNSKTALFIGVICIGCTTGLYIRYKLPSPESVATTNVSESDKGRRPDVHEDYGAKLKSGTMDWTSVDPKQFCAWVSSLDTEISESNLRAFFKAWIKVDPMAAFAALNGLPERYGIKGSRFGLDLWTPLLVSDPTQAIACLHLLPETSLNYLVHDLDVPVNFDSVDEGLITSQLAIVSSSAASRALAEKYSQYLAGKGYAIAKKWADSLPPEFQAMAMGSVLEAWYKVEPNDSLKYSSFLNQAKMG